jgi:exodeoxyribonuclease VII large subunit
MAVQILAATGAPASGQESTKIPHSPDVLAMRAVGNWNYLMLAKPAAETGQMKLSLEAERRIFQVKELNAAVQNLFEVEFRNIWVLGEISGCRIAGSGHTYFSLKDEQSQIKCALFKGSARFARFKPQDGLWVMARGSLEVYEPRGEYQLIVDLLEPQGAGALQLAFEQLKKKLSADGLFNAERKKPLPKLPRRIGVVTSPAGAVIRDILHVLERRFQGIHVRIYPAQVQGEGSMEQVCAGLKHFSERKWADVVIIARGGGSLEDLWTFNEETVARAIAASHVPVISAIGHETDFTIADFVADYRAPTPSAAAEIVIRTRDSVEEQIMGCRAKAVQALRYRLLLAARDLRERGIEKAAAVLHRNLMKRAQGTDDFEHELRHIIRANIEVRTRRLSDLTRGLQANDLRLRFAQQGQHLNQLYGRLRNAAGTLLWQSRRKFETLHLRLEQLSPLAVLARGYAIVEKTTGEILRSSSKADLDEQLRIRLHTGEIDAVVTGRREREG